MASRVPGSVLALLGQKRPDCGVIANEVDFIIENFQQRQQELLDAQTTIIAQADEEKRELTVEEGRQLDELAAEFDRLKNEIERRQRAMAQAALLAAPRARVSDPDPLPQQQSVAQPRAAVPAQPRATAGGNGGWRNFGEFALGVRAAALSGQADQRLIRGAAATTFGNEGVGAEGGFIVPPDFRSEIMSKVFGEASLVALTDRVSSSSNQITIPIDMTTPWQANGGIQAYWTGEAAAITQSRPAFENVTVRAHKLAVLVPVTEELAEDAPALDAYLRRKVPEKMDFAITNAIVRGDGVGKPLGFVSGPAVATVAAEAGQTADTIVAANVAKMFSAMPAASRRTAVWLIHPDAEHQLPLMTIGQQPIFVPPGGLSATPYGLLMGRPVIPHQVCESIGDLGDIMFIDPQQYLTLTRTGGGRDANGVKSDVSMHLWFDQDLLAYKTTIRIGGQPWWSVNTASRAGSFQQSPFVLLAAR